MLDSDVTIYHTHTHTYTLTHSHSHSHSHSNTRYSPLVVIVVNAKHTYIYTWGMSRGFDSRVGSIPICWKYLYFHLTSHKRTKSLDMSWWSNRFDMFGYVWICLDIFGYVWICFWYVWMCHDDPTMSFCNWRNYWIN